METPEPIQDKGYVPALYAGIKRCLPDKHIHLQTKTEYIADLITRAEPELMGRSVVVLRLTSRRLFYNILGVQNGNIVTAADKKALQWE